MPPAQGTYKRLIKSCDDEQTKEENGEGASSGREPRVSQGETHSPGGFPERGLSMEEAPLSKTEHRISWKFGENKLGE